MAIQLYGIERPDGTLVEDAVHPNALQAFLLASQSESGSKFDDSLNAHCLQANNQNTRWSETLAKEIALLMGYKLVTVTGVKVADANAATAV